MAPPWLRYSMGVGWTPKSARLSNGKKRELFPQRALNGVSRMLHAAFRSHRVSNPGRGAVAARQAPERRFCSECVIPRTVQHFSHTEFPHALCVVELIVGEWHYQGRTAGAHGLRS